MPLWVNQRQGSNALELLLVILILLVLGMIVLPAVHKVRELSNRVECQNRLRRLGHALYSHHDLKGVFPSLGGYRDEPHYLQISQDGSCSESERLGLGDLLAAPENQPGSWIYQILRYYDSRSVALLRDAGPGGQGLNFKDLICPARNRTGTVETPDLDPWFPSVTYSSQPEGLTRWARTDYVANGRLIPEREQPLVRFSNVRPGLAHAILLGEKWLDPRTFDSGGWILDGPALAGGSTCARTGTLVLRDASLPGLSLDSPALRGWGSAHSGGSYFLFAGGQVQFLAYPVPPQFLERLLGNLGEHPASEGD